MKKMCGLFFAMLFLTASANAASITGDMPASGNDAEFYAPGIINPAEGTVELTAVPSRQGSEFQNEWYFAFGITPGRSLKQGNNTLLGIYTPSGENKLTGFAAVARIGDKRYSAENKNKDFLKPGVPVNIALSWGKAGLLLYVDGKLHAKGPFPENGVLSPMPALFKLGTDSPFNVKAAKISVRQLSPVMLTEASSKNFPQTGDTSFLWSKGKDAEYFVTDFSRKASPVLMPVWRLADAMAPAGENAGITLAGLNLGSIPATYKISISAKTFEGVSAGTANQEITLPPAAKFIEQSAALPVKSAGFYNLDIKITGPDGRSADWKSTYMLYPAEDKAVRDGKFADYMGHHLLESPEVLNKLGIRWSRSWDCGRYFLWHDVEPQRGVFDWANADQAVARAAKNRINILGVLGYPPLWAAEKPESGKMTHEQSHMSGRWKPRSVEEWSNYVYQTVSRYKGQVKYWEIYNEVDFHPPGMPATFSGTTQEFFEMVKAAWNAAKKADPEAKILLGGFSTLSVCDVNMPYDLLKMGAAKYSDILSMHSYQGVLGVDKLRQAVRAASPTMQLWQTEQSWFQIDDPRKQAELTAAIQFWFIEKGFDKYFNFGTYVFTNRHTRSPEPLFQALAAVQNQLRKCDAFTGTLPDAAVRDFDVKHAFRRTDGNYFTAIGKVDARTILRLSGDIIHAEDMFGRELKVARDGGASVLPPADIALIVSRTPLKVLVAKYQIKAPCLNPGFEDISGDSTGGLKGLVVNNWTFRATTYDKAGEILPDRRARTGKYALKISASGQGRVYAFFETLGLAAGKYTFSAWLKSADGKPATAYFSMFDTVGKSIETRKIAGVSTSEYAKYTVEFELKKRPEGNVMFIIGTGLDKEQCSILCDDVELAKQPVMRPDLTVNVGIDNPNGQLVFKSGMQEADLQNMVSRLGGAQTIGGVTVEVSRTPAVLSGGEWSGTAGRTFRIPLAGYYSKIAFLVGAMFVPAQGGAVFGTINIRYSDASSAVLNLENNKNIRDWWLAAVPGGIAPDLIFADAALQEFGLFMPVWNNPAPGKEIASIEFKADTAGLLCLAAVVAEKK